MLINMPSQAYNHANPDKYRLPINNDYIPYKFETNPGW
jgi:dTDP-4-dehydrorhamnose 3,5-epimerase